ncbi:MAG TPA: serine protease [Candidatus Binatia bacterium]|nr:serine protease [Candidatus Binatia bacterium]
MTASRWFALLLAVACSPARALPTPDLSALEAVPRVTLDAPQAKVLAAIAPKNDPYEFAVSVPAGVTPQAQGLWDSPAPGERRWRLRLQSPGALSLSLHLLPYDLPEGAQLWIYDAAGVLLRGPYGAAQRTPTGLWTPIVTAEEAVIELRVPEAQAAQVHLGVAEAFHGFRDWKAGVQTVPGKAGSCNIDVACSDADTWRDEVRSVARIQIGGRYLCSGQLVNNVRQDLTPFFLTADHCGVGEDNAGPADSVVFYWNYQSSGCGGSRDGDLSQTQTGSTLVADDSHSDFTLLRLAQAPSPTFQVFFAGWNAGHDGSSKGVAIHHPGGDQKSISVYDTPVDRSEVSIDGTRTVEAWRVQWSNGTTEQGSSGGGLWNASHQLIGVLSGGSASCDNPGGYDYFGRIEEAWSANAAAAHQLKVHLDPDGTCIGSVPGRDPMRPAGQVDRSVDGCAGGSPSVAGSSDSAYHLGAIAPGWLLLALVALKRRRVR